MSASRHKRSMTNPTFREELSLSRQGYAMVAGLDEVGRGPLAGPVVAGVAILPLGAKGPWVSLIRDSKQLTPSQREEALSHLQEHALALEIGVSSTLEIDAIGIAAATRLAMKRALDSLALLPQYLLLDAFPLPDVPIPQKAIIKGDALCRSIAAASIAAKVARDRMMEQQDALYPGYGFASHKGYGTKQHLDSLKKLGPCPIHRMSFSPVKEMVEAQP